MSGIRFAGLQIAWDARALPLDPFAAALPLAIAPDAVVSGAFDAGPADVEILARPIDVPAPSPVARGAAPVLFHATTRCFALDGTFVVWDGASELRVSPDGRRIEAHVHASSLEVPFRFSAVTVMMALLLALRAHGLFHLHAGAARMRDGRTWILPGESGAGKSTLALALFTAGAEWLSDDGVLLRASGDEIELVGWTRMLQITNATAEAFPALRPLLGPAPAGSLRDWRLDPRRAFPGRGLATARAPFVLVFPSVGDAEASRVAHLARADALGRALHACAWVATDAHPRRAEQLALFARLVDESPAFDLVGGRGLLRAPEAWVAEIEREVR